MAEAEAPAIPRQELLYCERFVELLTDMLSQVRRFQLPASSCLAQCGVTWYLTKQLPVVRCRPLTASRPGCWAASSPVSLQSAGAAGLKDTTSGHCLGLAAHRVEYRLVLHAAALCAAANAKADSCCAGGPGNAGEVPPVAADAAPAG